MSTSKRYRQRRSRSSLHRRVWLLGVFVVACLLIPSLGVHAATLGASSLALSDPRPSQAGVNYSVTVGNVGSPVTSANIKCVQVVFSTTATGNTAPTGFSGVSIDTTGLATSTLVNSSAAGWSVGLTSGAGSAGQDNIVKYTNAAGVTPATTQAATLVIPKVTNSSVQDTNYWLLFNTFSDAACSVPVDNATVQFINTNGSTLSLTVNNTLSFTVNAVAASTGCDGTTTTAASTATTIPFGTVTSASNAVVCQALTAATNATNGFTVYARYTSKPTNTIAQTIADAPGNNTVPAAFPAPGNEAYGYTTNDAALSTPGTANRFTSPAQEWAAMTTTNAAVAFEPNGVTSTTFNVGHQVGISTVTHPGTYTTTVIYTCTPIY
jgi:hypothetical protein